MGKIQRAVADKIIADVADRNANRIRVYQKENGEVVIHYRQTKITLLNTTEIVEWSEGFRIALAEFNKKKLMPNDL